MYSLVVSLKFNPGHFSHLTANYKLFEELNYKSYLFINSSFNSMDQDDTFDKVNNLSLFSKNEIKVAVFWFPSLINIWAIIRLRFFYKAKVIYVFHEPFDSIKKYYKSGFSLIKIFKIILINVVNLVIIIISNSIILPSQTSLSLYLKKYKKLNKNFEMIPLLFDDEGNDLIDIKNKKYISYIGTVAADHAFNKFVDFAVFAMKKNWFPDYQFLIATSSIIPQIEKEKIKQFISNGKIVLQEGTPMSNIKINNYFEKSVLVWNAYNRSMQSGVLPKAFMFGAPVVMLKKNENEFMQNKITGILIEDNNDVHEIKNAIEFILSKRDFFFVNCRFKFKETFYYKNKLDVFKKMI